MNVHCDVILLQNEVVSTQDCNKLEDLKIVLYICDVKATGSVVRTSRPNYEFSLLKNHRFSLV